MKFVTRLLIAAALLATGNLALAQQGQRDHDRRDQRHERSDHHRDGRSDGRHNSQHDRRGHDDRRHDRSRVVVHHDDRRYGYRQPPRNYHHRWQRGHRYAGPVYVVRDYRHYRLRPPPRGYRWVRADNDYLLVAIATGIILDVALH